MKVIIKKTGEVKDVALGYAVNYLLPRGLAVIATAKKLADLKQKQAEEQAMKKNEKLQQRQQAERLNGKVVEFKVQAGKAGKIHGSIGKKEIAKELKIMKANIVLDKPIKKVGEYEVKLKFGQAKAQIKLKVISN
jgi:large subunit ribosomal protein L9